MPRPPSAGRLIARMLDGAELAVFALNADRQIVFANRALASWLGIDVDQLLGRRCDYDAAAGDDPLAAICAGICPPPEAFAGLATKGQVTRVGGTEPAEQRQARFLHLAAENSKNSLLLVVIQPPGGCAEAIATPALDPERLHAMLLKLRGDLGKRFHIGQLIGHSPAIKKVRELVRIAAEARARVLVVGPQGSGREHVARTIHYAQNSASIGALVPIACSLVDAEQMQASLAAILRRRQDSPTDRPPAALLLDIDRLRPDAQQELAGFLHLPKIELPTLTTARISLKRLALKGRFRSDLAHELSTLTIVLPPLARRRDDIPILAQHFLEQANSTQGLQLSGFQPAAIELLAQLPWPGNIDELAQAVRAACSRARATRVGTADFPDWVHLAKDAAARPARDEEPIQLDEFLAQIEKELLARAMRRARANKSKAAQLLGLSRQRLLRRLAQLGLISKAEAEEPVVFEPLPDEP